MIIDAVFTAVSAVLSLIFAALPEFSLASFLAPAEAIGNTIGNYMAIGNGFLPLDTVVTILYDTYLVLLPALVIYKAANWVWRHIPELWGFGPGAG